MTTAKTRRSRRRPQQRQLEHEACSVKPLLLGIDIGTTGAKAVLIDSAGVVLAEHTTEYQMYTPKPGWAEQSPEDWWQATIKSIRQVPMAIPASLNHI